MTTFKEIRGQLIRKVSTDPTNPVEGQMWYNNTLGLLKGLKLIEAWASSGSAITARDRVAGAGTTTAGLIFGGATPPNSAQTLTEEYNGSGFAVGGALSTARFGAGPAGTQTAALAFAGRTAGSTYTTNSEHYNGSSWTS